MKLKLYTLLCILCCTTAVCYLYLFADDRFVSKSQFSIIVDDKSSADLSAGLLSVLGGGATSSNPDTQSTIGFIHSADLLIALEKDFALDEHFKKPVSDFLYNLEEDASLEDKLEYYRKRIIAEYNPATGLIDLSVETYDPDLSYTLSQRILSDSIQFINSLNKDVANERLKFVRTELDRAQLNVEDCEKNLVAFQTKYQVIQPETIIAARMEAIQGLKLQKIDKEIKLSTLKATSSESPVIPELMTIINKYEEEIKKQESELAGADQEKLNKVLADYKSLELKLAFAIQLRAGAEILLEQTRSEAISKSRFFSIIQKPYLSEEYTNPRRFYLSLTWIVCISLVFYIMRAFWLSIFDRV